MSNPEFSPDCRQNTMTIFYYEKEKRHTSSDTDKYIIQSLEKMGYDSSDVRILRTECGKPKIIGANLYVGVTHTDTLLVVAFDEQRFGIDCESKNRCPKNIAAIIKKYFSDNEAKYIFSEKEKTRDKFLEIWVKKEAYVKCFGKGMSDFTSFDVFSLSGVFEKIAMSDYIIYSYKPEF